MLRKALRFYLKKTSNVKNTVLQWVLQNILENQKFSRTEKFMTDFYKMDFIKDIMLVKENVT